MQNLTLNIVDSSQNRLSISDAAAQTSAIESVDGFRTYLIWADVACWVKIVDSGGTANDVTKTTGFHVDVGEKNPFYIPKSGKIGAICDTGVTGTLSYQRV